MSTIIGIDFGTTNSLISVVLSGRVRSYTENNLPHPSVVCYSANGVICGRDAKERIDGTDAADGDGIIRSPKRLLGSGTHYVVGREVEPASIVAELMRHIKQHAIAQDPNVSQFDQAVVSIPVGMDGRKRTELRDALMQAGINIVQFVHEPLAALYCHFRQTSQAKEKYSDYADELALVFDWGGGTLDLTLCQLGRESIAQIANFGDNEVGGDFIDEAILRYVIQAHLENHGIKSDIDVNPGAKAKLLEQCEKAKMRLSDRDTAMIYVPDYFTLNSDARDIEISLTREKLNEIAGQFIDRGLSTIRSLLDRLDLDDRRIALCLATGGMINMPSIKSALLQIFGADRLHISSKGDRIISEGCAWIGQDKARLALAKPIEVVEARQSYLPVFKQGDKLPLEGEVAVENLIMYCVDPRDAKAKFELTRPRHLGKKAATDQRDTYSNLTVKVESKSAPFLERIDLTFTIDDNLIVAVKAKSALINDIDTEEIYDLEFSLETKSLGQRNSEAGSGPGKNTALADTEINLPKGAVCSRSNVTSRKDDFDLVPGEYLYQIAPAMFDRRRMPPLPQISINENLYYMPCSICGKRYNDPSCDCASNLHN